MICIDKQYACMYLYVHRKAGIPTRCLQIPATSSAVQMVRMTTGRVKQLMLVNSTFFCHTVSWFYNDGKSLEMMMDGWGIHGTLRFGSGSRETMGFLEFLPSHFTNIAPENGWLEY